MMAFDAMAVAIDWLDAYRAKDIEAITAMYAVEAMTECDCSGHATIGGELGLRTYWLQRFTHYPAAELENIEVRGDTLAIAYRTEKGVVAASMEFDSHGKILRVRCGQSDA